jgi:hypothetical protein
MSVQNQVERQLQDEFNKFNNAPYAGKGTIPANLVELFSVGYMGMPVFYHKIQALRVKSIIGKELDELNPSDINEIIKVIVNIPPERFFDNIDEALEFYARLDKFLLLFNDSMKSFSEDLEMKRTRLMDLSGLNGGAMPIIGR